MSWRRRLLELACAGGTLASCDSTGPHIPCGNANPDPCVCNRMPADSPQCKAEAACEARGEQWDVFGMPNATTDGGVALEGHCGVFLDAGIVDSSLFPDDAIGHD